MEQALPQPRPECPRPPAGARAWCAAAFALVLETFEVGSTYGMPLVGDDVRARAQWGGWPSDALLECTGDQHRRPAPFRLDKKRRGAFRRTLTRAIHRSTHSRNAGGRSIGVCEESLNQPHGRAGASLSGYRTAADPSDQLPPRIGTGWSRKNSLPSFGALRHSMADRSSPSMGISKHVGPPGLRAVTFMSGGPDAGSSSQRL